MTLPEEYAEAATMPIVSMKGAVKTRPGFRLGPMDLQIEAGYVVALVGPNGSGKSTLFRLLMHLERPDEGEVRLFGERYPQDEVGIKRRVGYVPELSVGHDDMTAEELGAFVSRWYPTWNGERYGDLVRRFEIDPGRRFDKLSKGMQRRLAFAVAVACEPELLLLDEPTVGVDPFARRTMMEEIVCDVEAGDRTVVFATHNVDEVRRVADYVAFLHGGRFLGFHEKDALLERWKALWVERPPDPEASLPGLVSVEGTTPARLVTNSPEETRTALEQRGAKVLRTTALDLEEILSHLAEEAADDPNRPTQSPFGVESRRAQR